MRKYILIFLGILLFPAVIIAATFYILFVPRISSPNFAKASNAQEAYLQDVEYLKNYADYDMSFSDESRKARFIWYIDSIVSISPLFTPAQFELTVARAVALSDNGHSNVSPIGRSKKLNHLPIRFGSFKEGLYVLQARKDYQFLLGARVDSIASEPVEKLLDDLVPYFGGVENRSRLFAALNLGSPELIHALGYGTSDNQVNFRFTLLDGNALSTTINAIPSENQAQPYGRTVYQYQLPEQDKEDWIHLMADSSVPLYLSNPDAPYYHHYLDSLKTTYVRINFNYDVNDLSLIDYLDNVINQIRKEEARHVIVDLRFNGGGTDATVNFSKELPNILPETGKIFVITSAETFSAGIGAVATIKYYGKEKVTIVGEPIGDRSRFIANGGTPMILPNSGISIPVWSSIEDYGEGCWDWTTCFWLSPMFRKSGAGSLSPDISTPLKMANYLKGDDLALDTIASSIQSY